MRCRICGERWDLDSLHDEVLIRVPNKPWMDDEQSSEARYKHEDGKWHNQKKYEIYFGQVVADFQRRGCVAITGSTHNEDTRTSKNNSDIIGVAYQLMGDDVDGAISMMEDAESMGLFD